MKTKITLITSFVFLLLNTLCYGQFIQKGADIDGEAANDWSGHAVSMPDANTVAIGANLNDGNGTNAGHVRIYTWNGSTWVQKGMDIDGEAAGDISGKSVSMPDANTIAIGGRLNSGNGSYAGHVRIYTWNGSAWILKGMDIDGEAAGDQSGYSVSMPNANTIAIGAPYNDENGYSAGHVRIYTWNGSAWTQKGTDIDGEATGDQSGYSVSMTDANTVAIGATGNDGNGTDAGHVRIYTWNGSTWIQKGLDIDGEAAGDYSGHSVSMPNVNTVAIGAIWNDGNGDNAGHARIYTWNGNAWIQKGIEIDGKAAYDNSGFSVSMPDANTVAIGAPYNNNGNGADAGHARIYTWSSPLPVELVNFNATCHQNTTHITWTTLSEINNDFFIVEKSVNGHDFFEIATIKGAGNSNSAHVYNITDDNHSEKSTVYYRLKQVDFDGSTTYHQTIPANCLANKEYHISIYPNPNKGLITVDLDNLKDVSIVVKNTIGQLVYQTEHINTPAYQFKLQVIPGIYFIEISTNNINKKYKLIME